MEHTSSSVRVVASKKEWISFFGFRSFPRSLFFSAEATTSTISVPTTNTRNAIMAAIIVNPFLCCLMIVIKYNTIHVRVQCGGRELGVCQTWVGNLCGVVRYAQWTKTWVIKSEQDKLQMEYSLCCIRRWIHVRRINKNLNKPHLRSTSQKKLHLDG